MLQRPKVPRLIAYPPFFVVGHRLMNPYKISKLTFFLATLIEKNKPIFEAERIECTFYIWIRIQTELDSDLDPRHKICRSETLLYCVTGYYLRLLCRVYFFELLRLYCHTLS